MQIQLFHLQNSRSQRVIWFLEELQLDYELITCSSSEDNEGLKKLRKLDPNAKFPTIHILTENDSFFLSETSAIIEYLSSLNPALNISNFSDIDLQHFYYWKNFSEASFLPDLVLKQVFHQITAQTPFLLHLIPQFIKFTFDKKYLNPKLKQYMKKIDLHLSKNQWMAGKHFSIADILIWFPIHAYDQATHQYTEFPHIQRYILQIESRPAFQKALSLGQWSNWNFKEYWMSAW